jgi:hypothetical protein
MINAKIERAADENESFDKMTIEEQSRTSDFKFAPTLGKTSSDRQQLSQELRMIAQATNELLQELIKTASETSD